MAARGEEEVNQWGDIDEQEEIMENENNRVSAGSQFKNSLYFPCFPESFNRFLQRIKTILCNIYNKLGLPIIYIFQILYHILNCKYNNKHKIICRLA